MSEREEILDGIHDGILFGETDGAVASTQAGVSAGLDPMDLVDVAMMPALREVGRRFESGGYFLPEMLVAAAAMKASMDVVRPLLREIANDPIGTFVMGTVAGDIHDIGKNICNVMLESSGFKVIDLGINVPAEDFVEAIRANQPDAVGMSAFLTTTMRQIERNIEAIEAAGLRDGIKILIGGAPVNQEYADQVGADGYAPDANSTTRITKQLLGLESPQ